jgi:hypothetical protein
MDKTMLLHTPGPWKYFEKPEIDKQGVSHKYVPAIVVESDNFRIELSYPAMEYVGEERSKERKLVAEANARLIATAPDLLSVLKEAVDHAHVYDTNPALVELFQAMIQKATVPENEIVKSVN